MRKKRIPILITVVIILLGLGVAVCLLWPSVFSVPADSLPSADGKVGFDETILALDTSAKLLEFINANFTLEPRAGLVASSPEELYAAKKGGAQDFAVFAAYVLDQHKYEAGVVRYRYLADNKEKEEIIVPFRDLDLPRYIYFDGQGARMIHHGWSFDEMFKAEETRLGISITESAVFNPGVYNLTADQWYPR